MKIVNKWWVWAIIATLVTIVAMFIYSPVFYLNDDITMRSILSGAYTGVPNGHAVYMKYPLTGILAVLYKVLHFIPWFDILLVGSIWGCMLLLIYYAERPYVGFGIAVALYLPFCLYVHYTIVAALVASTAVFILTTGKNRVWPVILLLIAYMIRSQVGLLSLPFVAAAMVWRLVATDAEKRKQECICCIKQGVALLVGILLCGIVNNCFYASDNWKSYTAYNDSRTLLYDYTDFLSTDSYAQNYEAYGMTAQEYKILASYDTMLDAGINERKMQEIAENVAQNLKTGNSFSERLKDTFQKYYLQIRYNDKPFSYLWLGAYLFLGVGFILSKKWMPLVVLGILGVGRSSIWTYFIWQGRFPERVSLSLYMLELMLLLGMGMWLVRNNRSASKGLQLGIVFVCSLCFLYVGGTQWKTVIERNLQQELVQEEWTALKEYCGQEENRLYLVDVFSVVEYADFLFEEDSSNMMLLGGWMSASPLAQERFQRLGYQDGAECLYNSKEVSLIAEEGFDVVWLEEYLQNRFGECTIREVARIDSCESKCFVEYRVVKGKE